ncbi:MAG: glutamate--tRNA ligase [Alphaproteobacteria bacterium]
MSVSVRFAPSPTGHIHVGNVRMALFNWLYARANGGTFLLRLDDTDAERSTDAFAQGIRDDLNWLGLNFDDEKKQSDRTARYEEVRADLVARGLLYPCYETPEELSLKRKVAMQAGKPPVYDRAALNLSDDEKAALEADGRQAHWRFKLSGKTIEWEDMVQGHKAVDLTSQSDPVFIRADGTPTYMLPSVVDDIDYGITHVLRGEDHVTNAAVQIEMARALGAEGPAWGHISLLTGAKGEGLSKRLGSLAVRSFREDGLEPGSVTAFLGRLGTSDPVDPAIDLSALVESFDLDRLGRAPAKFSAEDLAQVNAKRLHTTDLTVVADRLGGMGVSTDVQSLFWETVRDNITKVADAAEWWNIVSQDIEPVIEDADYIAEAAALLPEGPYDLETWAVFTGAVKEKTGRKGKQLFMPLRLALTGKPHGPDLKKLLVLIGPERAKARLEGKIG